MSKSKPQEFWMSIDNIEPARLYREVTAKDAKLLECFDEMLAELKNLSFEMRKRGIRSRLIGKMDSITERAESLRSKS